MTTQNDGDTSNQSASSGSNSQASGEGQQKENQNSNDEKQHVSYETYKKTLDEAKTAKAKLRALEEEKQRIAEEKMIAEGNWKGLLEARDNRIKQLEEETNTVKSKYGELNETITGSKKLSKVLSKIGGDIDDKYFGLIDISEVKVNPETGEVDDMSAAKVAENFRTMYPETIKKKFNPNAMGENKTSSNDAPTTISYDAWCKLSWSDQKKWKFSQIKN